MIAEVVERTINAKRFRAFPKRVTAETKDSSDPMTLTHLKSTLSTSGYRTLHPKRRSLSMLSWDHDHDGPDARMQCLSRCCL